MESPALRQLEKKLEHTFDLIERLKGQTQLKVLSYSKKDKELEQYKATEEQLTQEIAKIEKDKKLVQLEYLKKQKEVRKRLEGVLTRLSILDRSV